MTLSWFFQTAHFCSDKGIRNNIKQNQKARAKKWSILRKEFSGGFAKLLGCMPKKIQLVGELDERGVAQRWTAKLAQRGFTAIANDFLDHYQVMGISNPEALFIIFLMRHKWDAGHPFPGYKSVGVRMGVAPRRTRQIAIGLEKRNLIVRVARSGRARSHAFDLTPLFERLEHHVETLEKLKKERR